MNSRVPECPLVFRKADYTPCTEDLLIFLFCYDASAIKKVIAR